VSITSGEGHVKTQGNKAEGRHGRPEKSAKGIADQESFTAAVPRRQMNPDERAVRACGGSSFL